MSIAIAKNHMAEMNMLGMLAVLDQTTRRCDSRQNQLQRVRRSSCCRPKSDYRQERKTSNSHQGRQVHRTSRVRGL